MRLVARPAATALTFDADPARCACDRGCAATPGPGLLVLDGVLAVNVRVGDRVAAELLGPRRPGRAAPTASDDELLACVIGWRALVPVRFAMLDARVRRAGAGRGRSSCRRCCAASSAAPTTSTSSAAIASQPRLEVRLALLLWHLAARWGRVEPGGIRLPLPLTHQLLGRLVGAERPSVSHALARLARRAWSPARRRVASARQHRGALQWRRAERGRCGARVCSTDARGCSRGRPLSAAQR